MGQDIPLIFYALEVLAMHTRAKRGLSTPAESLWGVLDGVAEGLLLDGVHLPDSFAGPCGFKAARTRSSLRLLGRWSEASRRGRRGRNGLVSGCLCHLHRTLPKICRLMPHDLDQHPVGILHHEAVNTPLCEDEVDALIAQLTTFTGTVTNTNNHGTCPS